MNKTADIGKKNGLSLGFQNIYKSSGGVIIAFVVLFVIMALTSEHFLKWTNMVLLMKQTVSTAILAYGMAFVLISGGIDLSLGATVAMSGVGAALMMRAGMSFYAAMGVMLIVSVVIGLTNGLLVAFTPIPAFIVTMAMGKVVRGFAYIVAGGLPVSSANGDFYYFANHMVGGIIPNSVIWMVGLMLVLSVLLKRTAFGRYVYATGGNQETALYSGINVPKVKISVFVIASVLASIAGLLIASRVTQGSPSFGEGYETNAVAAAVLGGVSFTGGRGTILGCFLGALLLALISNGLYMLDVSYYTQMVIEGLLILISVYVDVRKRQREK